jgi:hypothetical protein
MSTLRFDDLACPRCGHRKDFHIDVTASAYLDVSSPCVESDYHWDAKSICTCLCCGHEGLAGHFARRDGECAEPLVQSARTAAIAAREALTLLVASCEEALDGRWDRSDDGFDSMIEIANRAIDKLDEVQS